MKINPAGLSKRGVPGEQQARQWLTAVHYHKGRESGLSVLQSVGLLHIRELRAQHVAPLIEACQASLGEL